MKLPFAFCRLPLQLDVDRLNAEVAQFAEHEWQRHPTGYQGNSALRLISVQGQENDDFAGPMAMTPSLKRCPYIRQILSAFGVAWSRSRLMRLAPGASVPPHSDVNYHWFTRVRLHIPVRTSPEVTFTCGAETVHMAAGEAWLFDNWRLHEVHNGSSQARIHLVADTCGSAAFWNLVGAGQTARFDQVRGAAQKIPFRPEADAQPLLEQFNVTTVMHPSEVEQLSWDLLNDLRRPATAELAREYDRFAGMVVSFCREWRMLWSAYGESLSGWQQFRKLRDWAIEENGTQSVQVACASNGMPAREVFYPRVLLYSLVLPGDQPLADLDRTQSGTGSAQAPQGSRQEVFSVRPEQAASTAVQAAGIAGAKIDRPVFIVAAPRSGSSLLFETLARAQAFHTVGGESHWLVEELPQLRPWEVGSNRLTAAHVNADVRRYVIDQLSSRLIDRDRRPPGDGALRVLEKTPKHALRIPFFGEIFPDARFIFLWRDPRENVSSIMDAWRSGGWVTYPQLPGWEGPWSLLLPPDWQALKGRPLEEVAAFQWRRTNEIIRQDLEALPPDRWTTLAYADFLRDPQAEIERLCRFAEIEVDPVLSACLTAPLPLSAHTLTPPRPDKWRVNEALIQRVLPQLEPMWGRLQALSIR